MYLPKHFEEERLDVLTAFIRDHPFATLVSSFDAGLFASHVPMLWDPEPAPLGTLTGHVARPNPHGGTVASGDSLAIFLGPHAYVSPSWYAAKAEHGKVVPTWNYVAVHARGPLRTIDDPEWLRGFVTRLTATQERTFPRPWEVTDAPAPFVASMLTAIVGLEMPIRRLEGKWKLGQNRPAADVAGTIAGLEARGDAASVAVAAAIAARRRARGD
jgi:transcriptional regulator